MCLFVCVYVQETEDDMVRVRLGRMNPGFMRSVDHDSDTSDQPDHPDYEAFLQGSLPMPIFYFIFAFLK